METRGDVQEGIDTAYYAAGEGRRLFGQTAPSELPDKFCVSIRQPIGVAGVITPWNFPMAIPTWKIFPALLSGNSVVFKPASDVPLTGTRLVEILLEAGVPPLAINLVHGTGSRVGVPLVEHPGVDVVSFTGSSVVGRQIGSLCGQGLKRLSLELGGKNAQIVMDDADLDLALEGVLWGAFGTTGQRCTATSRLILQEGIWDEFVDRLVEKAKNLKLGDGLDDSTDVGPVVNEKQRENIHSYVEIGQQEGAKLLCGGEPANEGKLSRGFFYKPTIFVDVTPQMRIAKEEIFGPVAVILRAEDFDEAMDMSNKLASYGNAASIFAESGKYAREYALRVNTGNIGINIGVAAPLGYFPLGELSFFGALHGQMDALDFFADKKVVITK